MTNHRNVARRRLDIASLALALLGLVFGIFCYWLITTRHINALIIVPSVVAFTMGASHMIKREAPRE